MNRTGSRSVTIPHAALGSMLVLAALLAAPAGRAQDKSGCSFSVDQASRSRGDPFTLSVANGPAAAVNTAVTLAARNGQAMRVERPTYAAANGGVPVREIGKMRAALESPLGGARMHIRLHDTRATFVTLWPAAAGSRFRRSMRRAPGPASRSR